VVLLDAGYGNHTNLRTQISTLALNYVAGILSSTSVWASATKSLPPKRCSGRGRRPAADPPSPRAFRGQGARLQLARGCLRTVTWREGSSGRLSSRFARVRVRAARRGGTGEQEWLLIEWPKAEKEPTNYWLSTLPHDVAWARMVDLAKLRWRIERVPLPAGLLSGAA
jgi:SRSO17 transposase